MSSVLYLLQGCSGKIEKLNEEISLLKKNYMHDSRTDICTVEVKKGNGDTITLKGETTIPGLKTALLKYLGEKQISLTDSILILPDTITNHRFFGIAALSVINLRKEPDHSSELVSQAVMGTPVMILKTVDSWIQVRTPDRYISWTERSSIRSVNRDEMKEWKNSDRVVFTDNTGWIYSNIAETGVVGDLVAGSILARRGESGPYARVVLPDGREGFVLNSSFVSFDQFRHKDTVLAEDIINRASSLTGVPYLWGGSAAKGIDCSGFVQTVFFMNGLIMARDASQQALYGDSLDISHDFSNLRAGDLLFFGSPRRITHVAIYKGDGDYIHSSGRVMVNSLDSTRSNYSSYRRNSLVKAMRVLNSPDPGIVPVDKHPWY
ncbi:MAG: NlpC/P60 family protein [Chloroflexota bacterium]